MWRGVEDSNLYQYRRGTMWAFPGPAPGAPSSPQNKWWRYSRCPQNSFFLPSYIRYNCPTTQNFTLQENQFVSSLTMPTGQAILNPFSGDLDYLYYIYSILCPIVSRPQIQIASISIYYICNTFPISNRRQINKMEKIFFIKVYISFKKNYLLDCWPKQRKSSQQSNQSQPKLNLS